MFREEYAILVENMKKSYGKTCVLDGVDLKIKKGSVFCLLGSNGAGKSTMIKILATLLPFDEGRAVICGADLSKQPARVREFISLTGQYAAVDELLTGYENLLMTARLFHIKNPKKRTEELLCKFKLSDKGKVKVSNYSGGMRRRLDIAMSMTSEPEVIFLDEPTTGLDPQSRSEMRSVVRELTKTGVTIFLTTHYLDEAEALADHIAVLQGGKIIKNGTPEELKKLFSKSRVNLFFDNSETLKAAKKKLSGRNMETDENTFKLTVMTDGTVGTFAEILNELKDFGAVRAEQEKSSLEDVFLKLVEGDNNEKK